MVILTIFRPEGQFSHWDTLNSDFGAKNGTGPMWGIVTILRRFHINFCIRIFKYSVNFDLGVTRIWAISAKKCYLEAYFNDYCFQNSPMIQYHDLYYKNCGLKYIEQILDFRTKKLRFGGLKAQFDVKNAHFRGLLAKIGSLRPILALRFTHDLFFMFCAMESVV